MKGSPKGLLLVAGSPKGSPFPLKFPFFVFWCVFELTFTTEVGANLFNFGLTVYSTNAKAGPASWAL